MHFGDGFFLEVKRGPAVFSILSSGRRSRRYSHLHKMDHSCIAIKKVPHGPEFTCHCAVDTGIRVSNQHLDSNELWIEFQHPASKILIQIA